MLFKGSAFLESTVNKGLTYFQQLFRILHDAKLFHSLFLSGRLRHVVPYSS